MNALLDTSFILELERQNASADATLLDCEMLAVSVMTFAEVLVGRPKTNRERAAAMSDLFQQDVAIFPATVTTARQYAQILHQLEASGVRINLNDIWIAATAIEHNLTLLTFDNHFARVEGLRYILLK